MFVLTAEEAETLRSQTVISKRGRGGRRYLPYAFTEQGVAMLSTVLNSERVIEVNIAIMRAFVRLREIMSTHKDMALKLEELERKLGEHDHHFQAVFEAIRQLMIPPPATNKPTHRIPSGLRFRDISIAPRGLCEELQLDRDAGTTVALRSAR
jgi:hypothetical protein